MRVDNRYDILSKLGSGAFSKVFSGKDIISGEDVAIKIDTSNVKSGQRSRALVIYEGDILAWLHKENKIRGIPRLYWSGYINSKNNTKYPVIIIDKLGDDLEKVLLKRTLSCIEMGHIGLALIRIIESIHTRGVLHRDLKPANIMLGYHDTDLYIADFGLAKKFINNNNEHISYCDNKSGVTGTLRYCSTYTHYGVESCRRDDLQSFLYILIFMLKGSLPWQSINHKAGKNDVGKTKSRMFF